MFLFSRPPLPLPPRTRTTTAPPPAPAAGEGEGREGQGRGRQQEGLLGGREEQEEGRVSSGVYLFICSFRITSTSITYIFFISGLVSRTRPPVPPSALCPTCCRFRRRKKSLFFFLVEMDFVKPFSIFKVLDKNSQNAVNNAAKELRRNYSKKVFSRKWNYFLKSENGNSLCVGRGQTRQPDQDLPQDLEQALCLRLQRKGEEMHTHKSIFHSMLPPPTRRFPRIHQLISLNQYFKRKFKHLFFPLSVNPPTFVRCMMGVAKRRG